MLGEWYSQTKKGSPVFIKDGTLLTIIAETGERGTWTADAPVNPGDKLTLTGAWTGTGNSGVRVIWFDLVDDVGSIYPDAKSLPMELIVPATATHVRVNCILSGDGTAVFDDISLMPSELVEEEEFLPVPPPDMAQKHHVTGWKWGGNIALTVHGLVDTDQEPPDYGLPYEVRGWQHGRNLDLQIGNMYLDEEE